MKRLALASCAALIGLVTAPLLSTMVDARPVAKSTVAVLTNPDYVDMGPENDGGEVENLITDLETAGHTAARFTDISAAGFTAALAEADVLAIPELEEGDLYEDLAEDAVAVINDFVEGGGRLVLFAAFDASQGLNTLFGFETDALNGCDESGDDPCELTAAAADTEFADGPATLLGVDATGAIISSTLPAGSTVIYSGVEDDEEGEDLVAPAALVDVAGVAVIPFGDGAIVTLGWDWFPDDECCVEEDDGGEVEAAAAEDEADWALVLDLAVSQPEVTVTSPSPNQLLLTSDSPSTQPVFVALGDRRSREHRGDPRQGHQRHHPGGRSGLGRLHRARLGRGRGNGGGGRQHRRPGPGSGPRARGTSVHGLTLSHRAIDVVSWCRRR